MQVKYFELGNEQYNTYFPEQVQAMEARAAAVGVGGQLYYINPANGDYFTKNTSEGDAAEALGMADRLLEDFHGADMIEMRAPSDKFVAPHMACCPTDYASVCFPLPSLPPSPCSHWWSIDSAELE